MWENIRSATRNLLQSQMAINLGILLFSLLLGMVIQKWLLGWLTRTTKKSKWSWDDLIVESLGSLPFLWCVSAGAWVILMLSGVDPGQAVLVKKVLVIIVIVSATLVAGKMMAGLVEHAAGREGSKLPASSLITGLSRIVVYITGLVILLQNLNIEITPLITALGLGGLAIALALEETLSNLFSGVQIIASRLVRSGDYVKLDSGYEGYVTDVKARSTTIRSFPDNNRIVVPNHLMTSLIVVNCNLPEKSLWVKVPCGVSYDSDLERVENITLEVAQGVIQNTDGTVSEQEPVFRYEEFGDSSINFTIRIFVKEFAEQFSIKHTFIKALHKRYNEEGIDIPFPIRTVLMKSKSGTADMDKTT